MSRLAAPQPHGAHHEAPSVETLIRHAHDSLAAARIRVSPAKVSRLVRQYVRTVQPRGIDFTPWFVAQVAEMGTTRTMLSAELYKRITHADPTGEQAARNVDADRRQAVSA